MEQLARLMSGADPLRRVEARRRSWRKDSPDFSREGQPGVVYFYVVDDVAFTVAGQDEASVEQLLAELP